MEENTGTKTSRIAKNTAFLYIRMLFLLAIRLYTSRILLEIIGIDDYGIYNLVGGIVVLFSFLEPSLNGACLRYYNVALGKRDGPLLSKYFSASIIVYSILVVIFVILAETAGLYFVEHKLNIPAESHDAAIYAYQLSILACVFNTFKSPYNALILAKEKMSFYAYTSLIESVLKLVIIWIILLIPLNRLVSYSILVTIINLVIFGAYWLNCRIYWPEVIRFNRNFGRGNVGEIFRFSAWGCFSSIALVASRQGLNIIMNIFYGVVLNAAIGIMNQVSSAVYGFIMNFQTAVNPQLIQSCAAGDTRYLRSLTVSTSKFSFYLLMLLALPLMMNMDFVLNLWLTEVPQYTALFCNLLLMSLFFNTFGGPIWTIIQAYGEIKRYQIIISLIILANLPAYYIVGKLGVSPYYSIVAQIVTNALVVAVGLRMCGHKFGLSTGIYIKEIAAPCFITFGCSVAIIYLISLLLPEHPGTLTGITGILAAFIVCGIMIWYVGTRKNEKEFIRNAITKKFKRWKSR